MGHREGGDKTHMPKTKKKRKQVEEEFEEELEDSSEDEELDEDESGSKKSKAPEVTFGVADLCALAEERTGKTYTTREMRILLRKLARSGKVNREIKAGNRARYDWTGPTDPEVKRVLKAVESGEIEKGKKEALDSLKERQAAKKKAKAKAGKKGKRAKAEEEEPEDEDLEEVDVDEDEDED